MAERHFNSPNPNTVLDGLGATTIMTMEEPSLQASRRRSSTLRSVALFQKFKDYAKKETEAAVDSPGATVF